MATFVRITIAVLAALWSANAVSGHYTILLPDKASLKKGESVTLLYQWGHPFEHQIFDALSPGPTFVLSPEGKLIRLTSEETTMSETQKKHRAYRFQIGADERGDYVFYSIGSPIWMEEDQLFIGDCTKVIVHVQAQKGWDASVMPPVRQATRDRDIVEMVPLTRPYGLQPGTNFQAQVFKNEKPLSGVLVEIERYNPMPPKDLPPDEHITRIAKTDPNGIVTCTLPESGWWCIAARSDGDVIERDGKKFPFRRRAILWVFVDEKLSLDK
jgi:uncharacterized GH25 family protein